MSQVGEVEYINISSTDSTSGEQSADDRESLRVVGDHASKIKAVVKCLKQIRNASTNAKTIVFSQWPMVLDLIDDACGQNGIQALKLYGAQRSKLHGKLKQFKTDGSVAVLLVPTKSGSKGLNIIGATHVIITEPLLNPAIELQAVGRVHRIGQTKETHVYHFVISDTVEENVTKQQRAFRGMLHADAPDSPRKGGGRTSRRSQNQESEALTIDELRALFSLASHEPISGDAGGAPAGTPAYAPAARALSFGNQTETDNQEAAALQVEVGADAVALQKAFWTGVVHYRGAEPRRTDVVRQLTVAASFQSSGARIVSDLNFELFGRFAPRDVARTVLLLSSAADETETLHGAIEAARARLEAESVEVAVGLAAAAPATGFAPVAAQTLVLQRF